MPYAGRHLPVGRVGAGASRASGPFQRSPRTNRRTSSSPSYCEVGTPPVAASSATPSTSHQVAGSKPLPRHRRDVRHLVAQQVVEAACGAAPPR